ncbi:MAG: hypothetical protein MSS84_04980 [Bacteroidales bacterium]|nr:hypothetical protein [Bacteroidales bacterium]
MRKITLLMAALMCGAWCATAQTTEKGHEYVDLGLPSGLKWATCNVGATSPKDYGDYFAWGETAPKTTYDWNTYKWCDGNYDAHTKYCNNASYGKDGFTDSKTVLDLEDDAARANWGGAWRTPTKEEWQELIDNCTWTWTENYKETGIKGYEVKATNENSIFLPAAGYHDDDNLLYDGTNCSYWSSSLSTEVPGAYGVDCKSGSVLNNYGARRCGLSVRAVVKESGSTTALQPATAAVNVYTTAGRIVCEGEFRIYDLLGRDVMRLNGSLQGVYVVKTDNAAVKVVVR